MTQLNLPPAVAAERLESQGRSGRLSYYVAGSGPPLLLLHSINAAASVREVQPAFEHAAQAFDTGALVYFQQPAAFFKQWDTFLAR